MKKINIGRYELLYLGETTGCDQEGSFTETRFYVNGSHDGYLFGGEITVDSKNSITVPISYQRANMLGGLDPFG